MRPHVAGDVVRVLEDAGVRRVVWVVGVAIAVVSVATVRAGEIASPAERVASGSAAATRVSEPPAPAAERPKAPYPARVTPRRAAASGPPEAISAPVAAGGRAGIAAFPPPGTKPVKTGIVVPDGFELPEGYVRHYQTTDDGKRLPAILMFHPDYEFVDERGEPVPLPEDRVVPPDMAPPELPVHVLEIPAPAGASPP